MTQNPSIQIHIANSAYLSQILEFYKRTVGENYVVNPSDQFFVATEQDVVIGIVRLAEEHDHLVLRGMQILQKYQRNGLGTQMLQLLSEQVGERECFCIPYSHLESYYGQVGFEKIDGTDAPEFLQERLARYRTKTDSILMRRPRKWRAQ